MNSMACTRPTLVSEARSDVSERRLVVLLDRMAAEGDARAVWNGRRARRTLQEMMPGYARQPILTLHRPVMADDACPLCGRWGCTGTNCPSAAASSAPAVATMAPPAATSGQCQKCGGRFEGWNGGVCDACRALGR
ncbi:hypothetical protein ACFUJR_35785 [Streptomyces sp. NPDC057271]|uniref:hypothetical protein n=1 Tax=unclassified Streptomyces TaxID=2593676 RepID=UPI0036403CD7